jgi:O-antigen/teichoic acid export membrane protein
MNTAGLSKYIVPAFLLRYIEGRTNLKKIIANTGWLFFDRVLRMGIGLLVGVWIARYLGPEQFGLWNYALAFTGLFGAFATLGLDGIVVRELLKRPESTDVLLGSAFGLRLMGGIFALVITLAAISLARPGESLTFWLVGLNAAGFIFQSINVVDFYFQAHVQSKYTVISANAAFLLITVVKIIFLLQQAPLIAFAWAGLAEVVIASFFLLRAYQHNQHSIRSWKFEGAAAQKLLADSWPLILSSIAIMVYMRIDQIMLGEMLGNKAVGIFSAAVRISEVWYFVPMAIASSVFPSIIRLKKEYSQQYNNKLQRYLDFMAALGIVVAIIMTMFSNNIVRLLYGSAYAESSNILSLHIWAGIFVAIGVTSSSWFIAENLQKYTFYRTLAGGITNIVLNIFLIPIFGTIGAAISTIISQAVASVFFNGFSSVTKPIFIMQLKALFPYRLLTNKV